MIDLHSHLLPAVDDGSRSVEQSVKVLFEMARQGVTDVCLTPHLKSGRAEAGPPPAHNGAFEAQLARNLRLLNVELLIKFSLLRFHPSATEGK